MSKEQQIKDSLPKGVTINRLRKAGLPTDTFLRPMADRCKMVRKAETIAALDLLLAGETRTTVLGFGAKRRGKLNGDSENTPKKRVARKVKELTHLARLPKAKVAVDIEHDDSLHAPRSIASAWLPGPDGAHLVLLEFAAKAATGANRYATAVSMVRDNRELYVMRLVHANKDAAHRAFFARVDLFTRAMRVQ